MNVGDQIRSRRQKLGMTLAELAEASGVSRAMLSDVERNAKSPTIRVLASIAHGLATTPSGLLDEGHAGITVTPAASIRAWTDESTGLERRHLAPALAKRGVEFVHYIVPPNADCGGYPAHAPGSIEVIYVTRGRIRYYVGDNEVVLNTGDVAVSTPDSVHGIINPDDDVAEYLVVMRAG